MDKKKEKFRRFYALDKRICTISVLSVILGLKCLKSPVQADPPLSPKLSLPPLLKGTLGIADID